MVAKKNLNAPKHPDLETISNLEVIKALQSSKFKGYVTEQFAWRHYYWYLTNSGIEYLRRFLHLPAEIVSATVKRQARSEPVRRVNPIRSETSKPSDDRSRYRRSEFRQVEFRFWKRIQSTITTCFVIYW
ncbi:hypothetical protein WA026_015570 [Henosepilachna vigintioctopunctata]|uniref:Plectin/eS10 N-terminal domain-containing protein n=1 Tax=Henosepilachna vigintioctopunctata TaxID=420089 RepID=A0AAW1VEH9_9CUCU